MGRDDMRSVFIGNLADSARNDDVTDFFKGYGKLTDISLKVNYSNFASFLCFYQGGYGFVEFEDAYDARDACKDLDGSKLCDQRVRIELSNGGRDRRRGRRSSDRGRSRRSRSGSSPVSPFYVIDHPF